MVTKAYLKPDRALRKRYDKTIKFINKLELDANSSVLDLGVQNPFADLMRNHGFTVYNTGETDLDLHPEVVTGYETQIVTALEILEHLVSPFPLLRNLPGNKLVATVPLRLWFKEAYRNPKDKWDCHYHEFEDWQFDWLLEKSGWTIVRREKWKSPSRKLGFRPFLRNVTPRYYAVYAERK